MRVHDWSYVFEFADWSIFLVSFQFFNRHFPVTTFGLILFSGSYANKFSVSVVPDD